MAKAITSSRAAERTGVGVETIRFYERRGLIVQPPRPRSGGYRFYDDAIVERVRFIRRAQQLGFSLREIADLLSLRADPAAECGDVRVQAVAKREDVDRKLAQLQRMRTALDALIASCPGGAPRACTIREALSVRTGANADQSEADGPPPPSEPRNLDRAEWRLKMKTANFKIDGIRCEGCARTVAALVSTEPGVRKATVSFEQAGGPYPVRSTRRERASPGGQDSAGRICGCWQVVTGLGLIREGVDALGRDLPRFVESSAIRYATSICRHVMSIGALVAVLGACQVGPKFTPPAPPGVNAYTPPQVAPDVAPGNGEPSQRLLVGEAIPGAWWQLFRSPALDFVVRQAIDGSPTIDAARAKLAASQQEGAVANGAFYPQLDAFALAEREKGPPFAFGLLHPHPVPTYNLYSFGPTASFVPDVFGVTARRVEWQEANAENQAYQLEAAQLTVTGNAVAEALTIASARLQIEAIDGVVADDRKNLALVQELYAAGKVDRTDLLLAQAQLENDRTLLPPVKQEMAAAEDALAILVGRSPAEWMPPAFTLDEFTLPADLPLSLPSALVRQRPDIMAAESEVHARSAAIGVAVGEMYPTVTLSAALDPTAITTSALFGGSNLAWNALSGITAPIFHGGALKARKEEAIDEFHASLATYRQTVLQGLGQVADILRALGHDAELVQAQRRALDASQAALELQRQKYAAGRIDVLRLLDAERSFEQARVGYARARAQRYLDTAQLFVALGGGWSNGLAPSAKAHADRSVERAADRAETSAPVTKDAP